MASPFAKSVLISAARSDAEIAARLRAVITEYVGDSVWIREFDLDAGGLILDSIEVQIAEARWFIFLHTAAASKSPWVQIEAHAATVRSLEDDDFKLS